MANSLASEPPLANLTVLNWDGVISVSRLASLQGRRVGRHRRRGKREGLHLLGGDIGEFRDAMSEIDGEDTGKAVDVLLAKNIPDPYPDPSFDDQRILTERLHLIEVDHHFGGIEGFLVGHENGPFRGLVQVERTSRDCRIAQASIDLPIMLGYQTVP